MKSNLGFKSSVPSSLEMSQTGKLMPNLDQQSTKMLNLTVLQRMDPFIEEILITAAHVTFYEFNIENNQWVGFSYFSSFNSLFAFRENCEGKLRLLWSRNFGFFFFLFFFKAAFRTR